jgi:hypothetical protein
MSANVGSPQPARRLNLDFWKFWTGETIANLGTSFIGFALPLLVYKLTGSSLNLGIATAAVILKVCLCIKCFNSGGSTLWSRTSS